MKHLSVLIVVVAAGLTSCGTDTKCGLGTTNTNGTCVPDGSMICSQGTKFNPDTQHCDVDSTACAAGTAFLNGVCVNEDDALAADIQESAEPNDMTSAGMFDVPAVGAAVTFHGCITPSASGARDRDPWMVTASGPSLLEITADGVHGLAAGFAMIDNSNNPKLTKWQRLGINLTGDMSKRQVYLPAAGTYTLLLDDSRSLILGTAAGGTNTCYFGTVKNVAIPSATAVTIPQTTGMDQGDARFLRFTATAYGDILDITQNTTSKSMSPSFVVMRNNVLQGVGSPDPMTMLPGFFTAGGLDISNDDVMIVVDNQYNYDLAPQAYTLDMFHIAGQRLPTTGTSVTVTSHNGDNPTAPYWDMNYLYFDVGAAGQIIHFNVSSTTPIQIRILRRDIFTPAGAFDSFASVNTGSGQSTFNGEYMRFLQPGRYYFVAFDPAGTTGTTYTVTSTLTNMTATAATYGTPMTAQPLTPQGSTFFSFNLQAAYEWAELGIPLATNWGAGQAQIDLYDLAAEGWLNHNLPVVQTGTQPINGSAPLGRIVVGDTHNYLVRVSNTGTPGGVPTFTLDLKERAHVNLGTIVPGTPINRTGMDNISANGTLRYLITGTAGYRLSALVTPIAATADIKLDKRSVTEASTLTADRGGIGAAETLNASFPATPSWIAFTITNKSAVATNNNLALNATPPPTYTDICPGGIVLPAPFDGTADDDFSPVQTLPAGYTYYGVAVTQAIVGANGFLAFGAINPTCSFGCFSNTAMPLVADPNNFIAGYWDDLASIKVCRKDDSVNQTVTFQWTGVRYASTTKVEFQTVVHQNGAVDIIYGPNQQADGASATVGVENATGTVAQQLVFNTAGAVTASSAFSVTTP